MPHREVDALLKPVEDLLDDWLFWRYLSEGLAIFRSATHFEFFQSPLPLPEQLEIDTRFHLMPLLPFTQPTRQYLIMHLDKSGVRLYRADPFTIVPVPFAISFPDGLEAVTQYYDFEEELQGRTRARGKDGAIYRSDDVGGKEKDHLLADYFRLVDEAFRAQFNQEDLPLVLAGPAYYHPIYRQVNSYPKLSPEGVTKSLEHALAAELQASANELLQDYFLTNRLRRTEQFANASGSDLTSGDLRSLLEAASLGRIEALFLREGAEAWGQFEENTLRAVLHDRRQPGDAPLLQLLALRTLEHGGEVYVVPGIDMPCGLETVPACALFRFAIP